MLLLQSTLLFRVFHYPWRFNSLLLNDPDFIAIINDRIDLFISTDISPDVLAKTICEACKAYLRGEIISYSAYKNKLMNERRSNLSNSLADLQSNLVDSTDPDLFAKFLTTKTELDLLATNSNLTEPLTLDEIKTALSRMQNGKCPGPDGFPAEFLKAFSDKLIPLLLNMFNES